MEGLSPVTSREEDNRSPEVPSSSHLGNNKFGDRCNVKASKQTKFPSPAELIELIFKVKIVEFSVHDLHG